MIPRQGVCSKGKSWPPGAAYALWTRLGAPMRTLLLVFAFLSWGPGLRAAHCDCGGDAFPGAALSAQTLGYGSVALSWGLGYADYEKLDRGGFQARVLG